MWVLIPYASRDICYTQVSLLLDSYCLQCIFHFTPFILSHNNNYKRYSWIKVQGTHYRRGNVVIRQMEDDLPKICRLTDIVMDSAGSFYFVIQELFPPEYFSHYHAYTVNKTRCAQTSICKQEDLCDHHSYDLHQSFDPQLRRVYFLVPKYHIIDINNHWKPKHCHLQLNHCAHYSV